MLFTLIQFDIDQKKNMQKWQKNMPKQFYIFDNICQTSKHRKRWKRERKKSRQESERANRGNIMAQPHCT